MNNQNLNYEKIKLFVYDFDGVMTNNKAYVDNQGNEFVQVNRADGLGISEIKKIGFKQIILSSEKNLVVSARAKKVQISCIQGVENKNVLINYCNSNKLKLSDVAYIGNDINDYEVMRSVGYTFCPKDAHNDIKNISDYVFLTSGGDGVIRELYDLIKNNMEK